MVGSWNSARVFRIRNGALLRGSASAAAVIMATSAMPVLAQAAPDQAADESGAQEIVVTAQRREEKLSKVPISVVAYNAEALHLSLIHTLRRRLIERCRSQAYLSLTHKTIQPRHTSPSIT